MAYPSRLPPIFYTQAKAVDRGWGREYNGVCSLVLKHIMDRQGAVSLILPGQERFKRSVVVIR